MMQNAKFSAAAGASEQWRLISTVYTVQYHAAPGLEIEYKHPRCSTEM